eukprot:363423-Chlamydomonas_euryale.AAC.9
MEFTTAMQLPTWATHSHEPQPLPMQHGHACQHTPARSASATSCAGDPAGEHSVRDGAPDAAPAARDAAFKPPAQASRASAEWTAEAAAACVDAGPATRQARARDAPNSCSMTDVRIAWC